jgi:L-serine dehydratase
MESLRELYRIGSGPSASHTLGPRAAAERFRARTPAAPRYRVALYGSLAATGRGHLTDAAIAGALAPAPVEFAWHPGRTLPLHPNGMEFEALGADGAVVDRWRVYSVGGGGLREEGGSRPPAVYDRRTAAALLEWASSSGQPLWAHVFEREGPSIGEHLAGVWRAMQAAIERGLHEEGALPGPLRLGRKAASHLRKALRMAEPFRGSGVLAAYALAVAEENAAGGRVATAPTCGAAGVLPSVLRYLQETLDCADAEIGHALATAGLFGNVVKENASISGAEVGCQGEIGAACAMAAAAATQLLGGTPLQIEYAAEMGLEHHLGLTCDPVAGLVQIPCIERNAMAAARALDCAAFALLSDGRHRISFDQVVTAMKATGKDLPSLYRETAGGGLAKVFEG